MSMFEPSSTEDANQTRPSLNTESLAATPQYPFRLIEGERVIASYPITSVSRPLGKLVSFLFVTDSRVVYAAESKTVFSSSATFSEYKLDEVDGIKAGRHSGLDALGSSIAIAIVLNAILIGISGATLAAALALGTPGIDLAGAVGALTTIAIIVSLIIGTVVVLSLARPRGYLGILAPKGFIPLAERDWLTIGFVVVLFLLFGPFLGIGLLCWFGMRALGVFRSSDAFLYANSANIDAVSFDAGAVILEAQARGRLAAG